MSNFIKRLAPVAIACASVGSAAAQVSWDVCIDPTNNNPRSNDWGINSVGNELMRATLGGSGTVTYGGQNGPCFSPAITLDLRGRIGFAVGSLGSVQSTFDNFMPLTFGMPTDPSGNFSYAMLVNTEPAVPLNTANPARTLFGANPWRIAFNGASDRYVYAETVNDNVRIILRMDVMGDAARLDWTLVNTTTGVRNLGLWFGQAIAMLTGGAEASGFFGKVPYTIVPGYKPIVVEQRFKRSREGDLFPPYVNFNFGQSNAFGLRVENRPTDATTDPLDPRASQAFADEFVIGDMFFLLGSFANSNGGMPDIIFTPDNDGKSDREIGETAYIQKFYPQPVAGNGGSRRIVSYYRSTWSVGSYTRPYTVVADSPKLLSAGTGAGSQNGIASNPFTIRVWVDNIRGFSQVDQEIPLNDVKVSLTLPQGFTLAPGETPRKIIDTIAPRRIRFVDFRVVADGRAFGNLTYRASIDPTPGPVKEVSGTINVAATPRITLEPEANLVGAPFRFSATAWQTVLQLNQPTDFQAFDWDAAQQGYVLSTGAQRGRGTWVILNRNSSLERTFGGNPTQFPDLSAGAPSIQLKAGWNLIANPYNYAIPLGQIVGVSAANPSQSYNWSQLVSQGLVSSALAFWNTEGGVPRYEYIEGVASLMQPKYGYWIFVNSTQDLTLQFPPVFAEWLPGSNRSRNTWVQSDRQWRLQLAVRTNDAADDMNYIGQARSDRDAGTLRIYEPPTAPGQGLSAGIETTVAGKPTRLAQALAGTPGRRTWNLVVDNKDGGPVTITWPNMSTVPKNVRFRMVDVATGATRDMRRQSGYTFVSEKDSSRQFRIEVSPGTAARAVIGSVLVSRQSRDRSGPIAISYNLSSDATTTIRVIGANGREVYTVTRGRADRAGDNSAIWALRDNQNRAVAPGTYQVEITAETTDGERVRRFVPVNVIR